MRRIIPALRGLFVLLPAVFTTPVFAADPEPRLGGSVAVAINAGAEFTQSLEVELSISTSGSPKQMYVTNTPGCKSGGVWQPVASKLRWNLTQLNARNTVYVRVRRGIFKSRCQSDFIIHDNQSPFVTVTNPTPRSFINLSQVQQVVVAGTCSEAQRTVEISGSISKSVYCENNKWSFVHDFTGISDGPLAISATQTDLAGNQGVSSLTEFVKDTLPPQVDMSFPSFVWANIANASAFEIGGVCSELSSVEIGGALKAQAQCEQNIWRATVNVTHIPDGTFELTATQRDDAQNLTTSPRTLSKDTVAPQVTVTTQGQDLIVGRYNQSAFLLAGACTGGRGVAISGATRWTSLCAEEQWTAKLGLSNQPDGVLNLLVDHSDVAGNPAPSVPVSLIKDTVNPTWLSLPTHSPLSRVTGETPTISYSADAADATTEIVRYEYALGTGRGPSTGTNVKYWTEAPPSPFVVQGLNLNSGTKYFVNMRAIDRAQNMVMVSSTGWLVDTKPPILEVQTPAQNERVPEVDLAVAGICETGARIQVSYGADLTGPSLVPCLNGKFDFFVALSGVNGPRELNLLNQDPAGNTTRFQLQFLFDRKLEIRGQVLAMAEAADGSRYYGGQFSGYGFTESNGAAVVDSESGDPDPQFRLRSGFNGPVHAVSELPNGKTVFAGNFTKYRGRQVNFVAVLSRQGELDLDFTPPSGAVGTNGQVRAVAVNGTSIYLGGDFTQFKGEKANRLAKVTWFGEIDQKFNPPNDENGADAVVRSLLVTSDALFVGGDFNLYRGQPAVRLAKINLDEGTLDDKFVSGGPSARVNALALHKNSLYLGGFFSTYQGSAARAIAKVDSTTGALDLSFSPASAPNGFSGPVAEVLALASLEDGIIAVGKFSTYRGEPANAIAKLTFDGELDFVFNPKSTANGFNDSAHTVFVRTASAQKQTDIFVGGQFTSYRGHRANHFAKISSVGELDAKFNPSIGVASLGPDGYVSGLARLSQGEIVLVGAFRSYRAEHVAHNFLKTDALGNIDVNFHTQDSEEGFDLPVRAIALDQDGSVFVGGDFTSYRGESHARILKINPDGVPEATFHSSAVVGADKSVRALLLDNESLFIGGDFNFYRGQPARAIAKVNRKTGELDPQFNTAPGGNGFNGPVYALARAQGSLFVGGLFSRYRGQPALRIAKLSIDEGLLDLNFHTPGTNHGPDGPIFTLASSADPQTSVLFLGGNFIKYRGRVTDRLAKIDLITGDLIEPFHSTPSGFNGPVLALAVAGDSLFVGGSSTNYRGSPANRVAKLEIQTGDLDFSFNPSRGPNGVTGFTPLMRNSSPIVSSLHLSGRRLTIGGAFTLYRKIPHNFVVETEY